MSRFDALAGQTDGLIALTAGGEGALARLFADGQDDKAKAYADRLAGAVPRPPLHRTVAPRRRRSSKPPRRALIDLAYALDLPLVATNPACYAEPDFHAAHDAMLCIAASTYVDNDDRKTSSPEAWLKPAADMEALFADLPEAIANTAVIAQRCAVAAPKRKPILPRLSDDEDETLRREAHAGLGRAAREGRPSATDEQLYRDRLDFEIDVITRMGFAGYFLIVADFIKWAKTNDIPVGPGRGSGAGSIVAWALLITDLDPIALDLLFERFLNPERVSMPDFDIDFCETHRDKVITYVQQKYGRDRVAQIITFGRLKARAVLKDTGRVLQMSYGQVDRLAKLIPNLPADPWDLPRALNGVSELHAEYKNDAGVRRLIDLAMKLEGLPRHSSTHAAGVVIGDRPLSELVPLYRDPRSDMPVTQFDMKYVEAAGLVKFDFLGLKTLSVLKEGQRLLALHGHRRSITPRSRGTIRRSTNCSSAATPSACSSSNPKACAARSPRSARPRSATSSRSSRSTAPARWTTSRCSATARTAAPTSLTRTRCSKACSRKPTASSSTRNRSCRRRRSSPATASAKPTSCAARWARRSSRR